MAFELVIIGGGNMGTALASGLLAASTIDAASLAIVEPSEPRRAQLASLVPGVHVSVTVPACTAAVLAVKPPYVPAVAAEAVANGAKRLLSVAAGVSTSTIVEAAGSGVAVLRTMPNTPALVGEGVSALAGAGGVTDADLAWAEGILAGVGLVVRVDEQQLDAVTGLTGSGPAYVFLIAEALMDAGVGAGLPRAMSEQMVTQLRVGSAKLLAERGDPAGLRAMVTSPAGTTAAGVSALEERAVRAALIAAVRAATDRSRELGAGS
jgi:pyrroline-5-carboxylate reductase